MCCHYKQRLHPKVPQLRRRDPASHLLKQFHMFCDTECILKYREHKRYLQIHHTTPFYVIQELLKDFWFYFDDLRKGKIGDE